MLWHGARRKFNQRQWNFNFYLTAFDLCRLFTSALENFLPSSSFHKFSMRLAITFFLFSVCLTELQRITITSICTTSFSLFFMCHLFFSTALHTSLQIKGVLLFSNTFILMKMLEIWICGKVEVTKWFTKGGFICFLRVNWELLWLKQNFWVCN